jgi:hypothetical protein
MTNRIRVLACVACLSTLGCGSQAGTPADGGGTQANGQSAGAAASTTMPTAGMSNASNTSNTSGAGAAAAAPGGTTPTAGTSAPAAGAGDPPSAGEMAGSAGDSAAGSGSSDGADAGPTEPVEPASGTGPFPPVTDFAANGPYEAVTTPGMGPNNNYTIYHPKDLAPNGAKNPIVGWMSGGGTDPTLYPLLPLLATHGFVVVASNSIPGIGDEANLGKEIIAGIDWAIAENERDGSMFFQKLNTSKLASSGYSMGSLATFQIAGDPRLTTTVHISGGNMAPEPIHNLHAPAAFLCGIPSPDCADILSPECDIAAANCDVDFGAATTPVFYGNFDSGHLGILTPPYQEQIQAEVVAWLRWQLMDDATIKARFVGEQCGVCMDQRWKVQQKNL